MQINITRNTGFSVSYAGKVKVAMTERIEKFLENSSGEYLVIVGTAHHMGEEIRIQQLHEKIYIVTPIRL